MDSELERCRRTDGRKWRCSKSVVPGQKYCERHLHRGRQGSRKRVEPSQRLVKSYVNNKIPENNRTTMNPFVASGIGNGVDVLNPAYPSRNTASGVPVVNSVSNKTCYALSIGSPSLGRDVKKKDNGDGDRVLANSIFNVVPNEVDYTDGNKLVSENVNPTKISRRKQSVTKNNHHGFVSPGFGLSPKSVLHCGAGKVGLSLDIKSITETEQQRCRRTDGKKWQCRRDAVTGQKYCDSHMHRGAKRIMLSPEPASNVPTPTQSTNVSGTIGDCINLNTVPASPDQLTVGNTSTSSTSDATTITDENISFCRNQSLQRG